MKLLADENFPLTSYQLFKDNGFDIEHIRFISPSSPDITVMEYAIIQNRIILTFDGDYGTLIFHKGFQPKGVVYFRLTEFHPSEPYYYFQNTLNQGYSFENQMTVIESDSIRQRMIK